MEIQCCSKGVLRFEIESRLKDLKKSEKLNIKIKKCPVLKGTFDLSIITLPEE